MEDLGIEDNIRTDIKKLLWESVGWINLSQNKDQWRVLVNTGMNIRLS
jgi:hypothetical protein